MDTATACTGNPHRRVKVRRISTGEYVAINTMPVATFSRKGPDTWQIRWGDAVIPAHSKSEGILLLEAMSELEGIDVAHPIRILTRGAKSSNSP